MDISVVIPTYNRYTLTKRAIESVLTQTLQPKEIIVVDDGSSDNTKQLQSDFPQIMYIYQENKGVSSARNLGIKYAKSEWIAFLDSDDTWHKEKLAKQVAFHQQNQEFLMSYTAERWVRDGKVVKIPKKYQKIGRDIFAENIEYCNIAPSSVLLHKKILQKVGSFDENFPACEDFELWLRIMLEFDIGLINEQLITKYAGHGDQLGFSKGLEGLRIEALKKIVVLCSDVAKRRLMHGIIEDRAKKC
ncbi:MAG: glycosyltransferase family 2 protein [Epsilonproteobacteria bacterium]|nr:glycosyltransferase family 2 protein [Campylobacterota bacterium]